MEGGVSGGGDGVDVLRDRRVGLQCEGVEERAREKRKKRKEKTKKKSISITQ